MKKIKIFGLCIFVTIILASCSCDRRTQSSSKISSSSISSTSSTSTQSTSSSLSNNPNLGTYLQPLLNDTCSSLSVTLMEITGGSYGDAIYINCGNFNMVVDAGNYNGTASINDGTRLYNKYLSKIPNKKLDLLITTHADGDHMGGIDSVFKAINVSSIQYIVDFGYKSEKNQYIYNYKPIIDRYKSAGSKYCTYYDSLNNQNNCGKRIYLMKDIYIDFLNTGLNITSSDIINDSSQFSDNSASVVFLMTFKDTTYFFGGDMTGVAGPNDYLDVDAKLINDPDFKNNVTFFKAAHHGSNSYSSNSSKLLGRLKPKYVGISAQLKVYESNYGIAHPNTNVISRMSNYTNLIYFNGVNGDLTFISTGDGNMNVNGTIPERGYRISGINGNQKITDELTTTLLNSRWYTTCYGTSSSARSCSIANGS